MNKENKIIAFVRPDDGMIFSINEDNKTFSLRDSKKQFPDALHHKYSKEKLMEVNFLPIFNSEYYA